MRLRAIALLLGCVASVPAFGICVQRDAFGSWHITTNEVGESSYCEVFFRANGTVVSGGTCEVVDKRSGQASTVTITGGQITVQGDCEITGSLVKSTGTTTLTHGQISRNGQTMIGLGDNSGNTLTYTGLKFR